jgi:hypothetical protein
LRGDGLLHTKHVSLIAKSERFQIVEDVRSESSPPIRNAWLRGLLVLLGACAALAFLLYASAWHRLVFVLPLWAAWFFVCAPLARLLAVATTWRSRRFGAVAYFAITAIDVGVCYVVGKPTASLYGVAGASLLMALTWFERWKSGRFRRVRARS